MFIKNKASGFGAWVSFETTDIETGKLQEFSFFIFFKAPTQTEYEEALPLKWKEVVEKHTLKIYATDKDDFSLDYADLLKLESKQELDLDDVFKYAQAVQGAARAFFHLCGDFKLHTEKES